MNNIFGNSGYGGFGTYPYPNQTNNFAQTYGQTPYNNQMVQQQQQMQPQPNGNFYFINGIEGAKAFLVQPNSTVILMDNDSQDEMFIKTANQQGQATIKHYELVEISPQDKPRTENKADLSKYVTKEEFAKFKADLGEMIKVGNGGKKDV